MVSSLHREILASAWVKTGSWIDTKHECLCLAFAAEELVERTAMMMMRNITYTNLHSSPCTLLLSLDANGKICLSQNVQLDWITGKPLLSHAVCVS